LFSHNAGGYQLLSFEELLNYSQRSLLGDIQLQAEKLIELCENYTRFFQEHLAKREALEDPEALKLKDELTFLRQLLTYLVQLQEDVAISENNVEANETRYAKEKKDLSDLLSNKSTAPKEQVYPKFAALAQAYVQLLEERTLARSRQQLFVLLLEIRGSLKLSLKEEQPLGQPTASGGLSYSESSPVERLLPQNTPDFMQLSLDYFGFCISSIVCFSGLLLLGNPNLGVFRFAGRNCVFSDEQAASRFLASP